jgi:hypothetical protein
VSTTRILTIILLLLTLAACGHKGPVQPLAQPLPAAPDAFELHQRGERLLLGWTIPTRNQDGSPLTDLAGFRIYKMRFLPLEDCPECRDTSVLWRRVDFDYLRDARRIGDRLFLWDAEVATGFAYRYRVVPVTLREREGAAAVSSRTVLTPPPPPLAVQAASHDRMARLSWEPPASDEPLRYFVYRHFEGEPPSLLPLREEPLTDSIFEDFGLENERTYIYTVRSARRDGEAWTESEPSQSVSATPRPGF